MTAPSAKSSTTFRFAELVGRYRLVVSEALLEFIERAHASSPEALQEAQQSQLHIAPDGTITSRAGDREFYRVKVPFDDRELEALHFEKAPSMPVTLVLAERDRLVAHQPNKPPVEFRRVVEG